MGCLCIVGLIHPQQLYIYSYLCFMWAEREVLRVLGAKLRPRIQYKSFLQVVFRAAVFSLTTTAAAVPALAHLSQRAHEEDAGPAHVCIRSKAICCKCVRPGGACWCADVRD